LVTFAATKTRWLRLVPEAEVRGQAWAALAELRIFTPPLTDNPK